ncbi:hypothetical protein BSZ21_07465 [Bradyrhizobium canariense]|nr:hypothetical protein BSZ21_07465 [Bradyrhizobium canariense]
MANDESTCHLVQYACRIWSKSAGIPERIALFQIHQSETRRFSSRGAYSVPTIGTVKLVYSIGDLSPPAGASQRIAQGRAVVFTVEQPSMLQLRREAVDQLL